VSTAIITIGLTKERAAPQNYLIANLFDSSYTKIAFPVFTFKGSKASLKKQVQRKVDEIFDQFEKE